MIALAVAALGCEQASAPAVPPGGGGNGEPCSQMHRAITRWQGGEALEAKECGPDLTGVVELTPVGRGGLLVRHRFSPPDEHWQQQPDGTFAEFEPKSRAGWTPAGVTLLPAYGTTDTESLLLLYYPKRSDWSLFYSTGSAVRDGETGFWPARPGQPAPWNDPNPMGRQLLGLAGDTVLDRNLSDGGTRIWRFVSEAGRPRAEAVEGLAGEPREAFRRGHRLVPLGPGRLLEWLPAPCTTAADAGASPLAECARFNIWSYALDGVAGTAAAPRDPFQPTPVASGRWAGVGAAQTLVADEARLFVWTRASGRIQTYRLDPSSVDPLAPSLLLHDETVGAFAGADWEPPTQAPAIKHVVLVLQDGRSFDSYFGGYCQGAPGPSGAAPACSDGPACCEAMPAAFAAVCTPLDPASDSTYRPSTTPACMRAKMNGGEMDRFAEPIAADCGGAADVACAGTGAAAGAITAVHRLAAEGALADRFFQSYAFVEGDGDDGGPPASSVDPAVHNLLYLTTTRFGAPTSFLSKPLLDNELSRLETTWAIYAGKSHLSSLRVFGVPDFDDPDWYPFRSLEAGELESDLATGELPAVAIVLPDSDDPLRSEAPGHRFDAALGFVSGLVDSVARTPRYADDTLVLVTYLTAGGYYDHVRPPSPPPLDVDATLEQRRAIGYGPRVPLLALGPFARKNHVSHVPLEMSSISTFIEWNWLYGNTIKGLADRSDPRRYRDGWVNGIGALLHPALGIP